MGLVSFINGVDEKLPFLPQLPIVDENLNRDNSGYSATKESSVAIETIEELENWPHFPSKLLNRIYFCK